MKGEEKMSRKKNTANPEAEVKKDDIPNEQLPAEEIPERLGDLDVLCIPSAVFETGPLTLREGVYSGCLVAGSDQIGQMDFLNRYGRTIVPNHANAWAEFMSDCIRDIGSVRNGRKTEFPEAKSMGSVAKMILSEMRRTNFAGI